MRNAKLYSVQDIETLKQKIAAYKDTLALLKLGDAPDDVQALQTELNAFKAKMLRIEGAMKTMDEKQNKQITKHEQQVTNFSDQIEGLNETVEALNQGVALIVNQLTNKVENQPSNSLNFSHHEDSKAKSIKEPAAAVQPQPINKRNFPSFSRNPNQTTYSPSAHLNMKSVRTNEQTVSIKLSGNSAPSFILTDHPPKPNDSVPVPLELVQESTSVEEVHLIEEVTPVPEEIHAMQIPVEASEPEITKKETSPFFKFFRRKS